MNIFYESFGIKTTDCNQHISFVLSTMFFFFKEKKLNIFCKLFWIETTDWNQHVAMLSVNNVQLVI